MVQNDLHEVLARVSYGMLSIYRFFNLFFGAW
uniref:Uncharacterized protein n=1 Tax=Arundo donax TaxID=35708 RepID=A0A0A9D8V5_ARUDO